MSLDPLLLASASALARGIREGQLTSEQVVGAHVARALAVNPELNAIVHHRYHEAQREAALADRRLADVGPNAVGPFHGVPVTIKECIGVRGLRKTAGLVARRRTVATEDAAATSRLRAAGAIPIGVTNVSELMLWMESDNQVYGRTNNPYDLERTAGGSSGGEGAIVGSGASPIGIGSDIGGSIRMPAFFNGVFGHKASTGLIPNTGHWPMAEGAARRYLTTGPLCRRAEDLWPALRVLSGPDGVDSICEARHLGEPGRVDLSSLTVYVVADGGRFEIDPELADAQARAVEHFAALGARIEPYRHKLLGRALQIWTSMMSAAAETSFSMLLAQGRPLNLGRAWWDFVRGRSPHTLPALGLAAAERILDLLPGRERAIALGHALKTEIDARLGDQSVLLYPSYPEPAPRHNHALWPPLKWQYSAIWNVLEVPVTQVPLGLSQAGLPLGVQVVGGHGRDHLTVAVALELERAFGGWVPPAGLAA